MADLTKEFADAGLLDGLGGRQRDARLALLNELVREGFSIDELKRAAEEERLGLLPVDRVLKGELKYTAREVAELSGTPLDFLLAVRRAMGFAQPDPGDHAFAEDDVEAARTFGRLRAAGLPDDALLEVTRVLGIGLAQGAEATRMAVARWLSAQGIDEYESSLRNVQAARELLPLTGPLLEYTLREHVRDQIRHQQYEALQLAEGTASGMRLIYVGFSDMVGSTRLGELIAAEELARVLGTLTGLAQEAVRPPARVVKTLGDAVMFVSPAPAALVETALGLTQSVEAAELPPIRSGLAGGVAISRDGDWYGPPVNLASRVTGVARPRTVLATREIRDATRDAYRWSSAGIRQLKGVKRPVRLYRVRRRPDNTGD